MEFERFYKQIDSLPVTTGVYRIFSTVTGDSYVGASLNIRTRCFQHYCKLIDGTAAKLLSEGFARDPDGFGVEVLKVCSRTVLLQEETRFIKKLKPTLNGNGQKSIKSNGKLITINEAARIKGVSRQAIHAAIKSGRLTATEILTKTQRITPEALAAFIPNPKRQQCGKRPEV